MKILSFPSPLTPTSGPRQPRGMLGTQAWALGQVVWGGGGGSLLPSPSSPPWPDSRPRLRVWEVGKEGRGMRAGTGDPSLAPASPFPPPPLPASPPPPQQVATPALGPFSNHPHPTPSSRPGSELRGGGREGRRKTEREREKEQGGRRKERSDGGGGKGGERPRREGRRKREKRRETEGEKET